MKLLSLLMLSSTIILTACLSYTENVHNTAEKSTDEAIDILEKGKERMEYIEEIESE